MVHSADLHTVFSELHVGALTLTGVALVGLALHALHMRFLRGRWTRLDNFSGAIVRLGDPTAYVAALFGVVGFVGSIITGVFSWPAQALWSTHEVINKVMVSTLALELWIIFVFLRFRYGTRILAAHRRLVLYLTVGFVAFALTTVAAGLGGHLAGKESLLDPLYAALGIDPTTPWILPAFAQLMDLVFAAPLFLGFPILNLFRFLLVLDVLVVVAIAFLLAWRLWEPRWAEASEEEDPCHPETDELREV